MKKTAVDPQTLQVWINQVHLYTDYFFNKYTAGLSYSQVLYQRTNQSQMKAIFLIHVWSSCIWEAKLSYMDFNLSGNCQSLDWMKWNDYPSLKAMTQNSNIKNEIGNITMKTKENDSKESWPCLYKVQTPIIHHVRKRLFE